MYARVAVARTTAGWSVSGNQASLVSNQSFPLANSSGGTATYFGIGSDATGTGQLLFSGPLNTPFTIAVNSTPQLNAGLTVTESGTLIAYLLLIFNNTAWTGVGDAGGLLGSATSGYLYLSLHTSNPSGGDQSTNEVSYS